MKHVINRKIVLISLVILLFAAPTALPAPLKAAAPAPQSGGSILCAFNESQLLGQPYTYPGGASGIVIVPPGKDEQPPDVTELGIIEYQGFISAAFEAAAPPDNEGPPVLTPSPERPGQVVILIADDFSNPILVSESEDANQPVHLLSHGDYVFLVAFQLLENNREIPAVEQDQVTYYYAPYENVPALTLVKVNVPKYKIEPTPGQRAITMQAALAQAIKKFPEPGTLFIVNMSFAVLPCDMIVGANILFGSGDLMLPYYENEVPHWRIEHTEIEHPQSEGGFFHAELFPGDTINTFDCRPYDRVGLWSYLMSFDEDGSPLELNGCGELMCDPGEIKIHADSESGDPKEACVPALAVYKAVMGDSLILRVAEGDVMQRISPVLYPYQLANNLRIAQNLVAQGAAKYQDVGLLQEWITNEIPLIKNGNQQIVFVAAAGNFDTGLPLAPGLWPEVVSVSSSVHTPTLTVGDMEINTLNVIRWPDSSSGELMAPGGWYPIDACDYKPGYLNLADDEERCAIEYVSGTSFAAPATSVFIAASQSYTNCRHDFTPFMNGAFNDAYFSAATCPALAN